MIGGPDGQMKEPSFTIASRNGSPPSILTGRPRALAWRDDWNSYIEVHPRTPEYIEDSYYSIRGGSSANITTSARTLQVGDLVFVTTVTNSSSAPTASPSGSVVWGTPYDVGSGGKVRVARVTTAGSITFSQSTPLFGQSSMNIFAYRGASGIPNITVAPVTSGPGVRLSGYGNPGICVGGFVWTNLTGLTVNGRTRVTGGNTGYDFVGGQGIANLEALGPEITATTTASSWAGFAAILRG